MALSFAGTYADRTWIQTGFTSFDIACAKVNPKTGEHTFGIPTRCGIHLYALTKTGKTHCALTLAGKITSKMGKAALHVPIDTFDEETALQILEFAGVTIQPVLTIEANDFESLDAMVEKFESDSNIGFGILDSVMAVVPVAEAKGSTTDANMGRRAKLISSWARKMFAAVKYSKEERIWLATNHQVPNIGVPGFHTTGGSAINGLTSLHIQLKKARPEIKFQTGYQQGWLLKGKVDKANWGMDGREFNFFVVGGIGIHPGLTAVYDCLTYGLASISRNIVYLQEDKVAKPIEMLEDFQNNELFQPFIDLLESQKANLAVQKSAKKTTIKIDDDDEDEPDVAAEVVAAADALYEE